MTDLNVPSESGRDQLARHAASEQFETARNGGNWMVICGVILSVAWIGGAVAATLSLLGDQSVTTLPTALLVAGGVGILIPAGLILMASFMARTNKRASAANALVLDSAIRLMAPAREAGAEGVAFAEQMKQSAAEVDRAMAHALSAMKAMSGEIGDERLRLESVAYASADNARDLAQRLSAERSALEGLARDLRTQITSMNEAIPRQAQMMVEAARQAGDEVGRADEALAQRLEAMRKAGEALSAHLVNLDTLAQDAANRTETLNFAVSRVEEKLDQSRKTVDSAVRAGEIAAAAASTTGDSLQTAVSSALDNARRASDEINSQTRAASEEAARTLAQLRDAAEQAAASVRTASHAARAETDMIERRLSQVSNSMHSAIQAPQRIVPDVAEPTRPAPTPAQPTAPSINGGGGYANGHDVSPAPTNPQRPLAPQSPPLAARSPAMNGHAPSEQADTQGRPVAPPPAAPTMPRNVPPMSPSVPAAPQTASPMTSHAPSNRAMDDELFDAAADALASASLKDTAQGNSSSDEPLMLRRRFDDPAPEPAHPKRRASDRVEDAADASDVDAGFDPAEIDDGPITPPTIVTPASAQSNGNVGWRDIISDMSREEDDTGEELLDREDIADSLINRLQSSGISLAEIVKPKAKRRIAEASRKGQDQRRAATVQYVGKQVERVSARLRQDKSLMRLAKNFVDMEAADALVALEQTQKTSRNASPRLAAYLLLDAAV